VSAPLRPASTVRTPVSVIADGLETKRRDTVATEEPMELRLVAGGRKETVAITMRTPGNDFELAAGFLHGEGIVSNRDDIAQVSYCTDPDIDADQLYNIVNVSLTADALPDLRTLERHFTTTSACGVCGKATLDSLEIRGCHVLDQGLLIHPETLYPMPDALRSAQGLFDSTGGLHAAGLFSASGELVSVREDVGRHNAVDKLIGSALLTDRLPLREAILMVSGRASYEITQKALAAGIPVVCAVSAPSSLAVSLAERFGLTLVGFLRGRRFNVYSGTERIRLPVPTS
jgi:FdhD protein